jgi:hypothetical protein
MDAARFDTLARSLMDRTTRRSTLAALLGGTLGLLGPRATQGKKGKKRKKKHRSPVSPPPAPTCSDGIQNGTETDVDCGGGTCPRCAIGKACQFRRDCVSAVCTIETCQACNSSADCGEDADGRCYCDPSATGGPQVCSKGTGGIGPYTSCAPCPAGTTCLSPDGKAFRCYKLCGAP